MERNELQEDFLELLAKTITDNQVPIVCVDKDGKRFEVEEVRPAHGTLIIELK